MISARELREISETSQKQIEATVARIEPKLVEQAKAGNRSYVCYNEVPWESSADYRPPDVTLFQQKVIDELKRNGYGAKIEAHGDKYVPRGLADDDGRGPEHQNYVLVIRW